MVGAAARQQDEGEDRRRRRRRTDPSESLVVIGRHRRYGVSVRARGGKRAGALRGEPCQLFPSCSWVSGVARNLTGSRLRGDGERGDLRDTHRPPPPYLCNSRCQATVVITSPSVCNGRPLADSCYAVDLVIPKTRARDRARPPLPARISSRRRPNVMDGTCLYQFVTTPIKNVLQLQRIKEVKWMNPRACTNEAYIPTPIEHVANVATHGIWIVPSVIGGIELIRRSTTWAQLVSACVYGTSLILVFAVSTFFHSVHYCNHNRHLKDALHRCDRAMIYIFIAASYFPWLNLDHFSNNESLFAMRYVIWIMAIMGILYQQIFHEKYKMLETIFYVVMGIGPSVAILNVYNYYNIMELKLGGVIYVLGLIFFKSDGRIPCAHAIWHLFVAAAAGFHYYAILSHVFPETDDLSVLGSSPGGGGGGGIPPMSDILKSHIEL